MSVQVNYSSKLDRKSLVNYVLFANENFQLENLDKIFTKDQISYINEIVKKKDINKNFLLFDLNSKESIVLIKLKKDNSTSDTEKLGADFFNFIKNNSIKHLTIILDSIKKNISSLEIPEYFLHGLELKSYEFNLYKSKIKKKILKLIS